MLCALVSGSFITGMTGYVTMGSNYPYVLFAAIAINFVLFWFTSSLSGSREFSFYQRVTSRFKGRIGHFLSSFIGMLILIILLFVATGESKTAAMAFGEMTGLEIPIGYYLAALCTLALIPTMLGAKRGLSFAFYLFVAIIVLRAAFIVILLFNREELPQWSADNMYNSPMAEHFLGDQGIVYIAIRLAFWSFIATELLHIWSKSGNRNNGKFRAFLIAAVILVFTMVPGFYISGLFPSELWQLIAMSKEGCNGACPSLPIGYNLGGDTGLYLMGLSTVVSHLMLVSICYLMISKVISNLSKRQMYFGRLHNAGKAMRQEGGIVYVMLFAFALSLALSMLNLSASYWVGLALYLTFGLVMFVQGICLANARYKWFDNELFNRRAFCIPTILSIVMMAILFYSGFKDAHEQFVNYAIAIFCFSLWVAATSMVYLVRYNKK